MARWLVAAWGAWAVFGVSGVSFAGAEGEAAASPSPGQGADRPAIARLLAGRCLGCHNPSDRKGGLDLTSRKSALAGGDSGEALVPGEPGDSLLWERVEAGEMPPKQPLTDDERKQIRAWIASGAPWEIDPIDPLQFTTSSRAGYDWWSLQPLREPAVPEVRGREWVKQPLDAFVLAALEARGLAPSPRADRHTLIRRLSFDLRGLPPTPEEVEAFLQDPADDAWDRLVDRYLDSPEYGERWARHWLDVVRFGESQGFERDKLRNTSWRYRDWVVWAFNRDLPYDEFVRLQIAGDLIAPDDPLAVAATGFLVAGPYDEVGQEQQSAAMKMVVRQDELEDIVGTTGQTFLGLTVHCARCHDHKFDPVSQVEYYRLTAALGGVRHGERETLSARGREQLAPKLAELETAIRTARDALAALEQPIRERLEAERGLERRPPVPAPAPIAAWEFDTDLRDRIGGLHATAYGAARLEQGALWLDGNDSYAATVPLDRDLGKKTLEAWVKLARLNQGGGAVLGVQTLDGTMFDAVVFGEREPGKWIAGSDGYRRTKDLTAENETAADAQFVHVAIVWDADRSIAVYRNGVRYAEPYQAEALVEFAKGKSQILFGLRHSPPSKGRFLAAAIDRARLYDRALSAEEVAASAGVADRAISQEAVFRRMGVSERAAWGRSVQELSRLEAEHRLLAGGAAYAVVPRQADPAHFLERGSPFAKKQPVAAGGLKCIPGPAAEFGLAVDAPEAEARLKLADWIASPENPLLARVIVNRLWHYHFGTGLVDTPNDFGFNGGRPSHPELLDHLAAELVRQKFRLKSLHRAILKSAAWQQSSLPRPEAAAVDADNRLLWRKSPMRLEAEVVRDAILAVSGELVPRMGGPGFRDFQTFTANSQFYEIIDPVGLEFQRRSLYRTWVRSGRNPLLDVLDCPDPSTTSPKRAVTTTPLQALALLNNSFVLRMSERFAERLRAEAGDDVERQVGRAYEVAYARPPRDDERARAAAFVRAHGLAAFCRITFNANEFVYVD